jgi:signal recognition particle receptor subunit beta
VLWFFIDSNDRQRLDEATLELAKCLREEELREALIVIVCNKQDLPNAMSVDEIKRRMGLDASLRYASTTFLFSIYLDLSLFVYFFLHYLFFIYFFCN